MVYDRCFGWRKDFRRHRALTGVCTSGGVRRGYRLHTSRLFSARHSPTGYNKFEISLRWPMLHPRSHGGKVHASCPREDVGAGWDWDTLEGCNIKVNNNKKNEIDVNLCFSILHTTLPSVAVVSGLLDSQSYTSVLSSPILNHTVPLRRLQNRGIWSTGSVVNIPNGLQDVRRRPWFCVH